MSSGRIANYLATAIFSLLISACNNNGSTGNNQSNNPDSNEPAPPFLTYNVVKTYPHDTTFFTEGLEFHDGTLFEASGGLKDETPHPSAFGTVDLQTGKVTKKIELDNSIYFGEGITFFKNQIYQLTYKNQKGFVYDASTFKKLKEFSYSGEGWSLTHDSTRLIMSNGSSNIQFLDPESLKVLSIVGVTDNNGPVSNLNELEYAKGFLFANQWQSDYILKIDLVTGKVLARLDLSRLIKEARSKYRDAEVLNGIAYNSKSGTFYITGKLWPTIYEISF